MSTRRKVVAGIVGLVALLVASAAVVVSLGQDKAQQSVVAPAEPVSSCGLSGTPGFPTAVPATWENSAGWFLPVSATDGPGLRDPVGPWSCFARTPSGAVLAGYVIAFRAEGVAENWQAVVRAQTVPGPAQQLKLETQPEQVSEVVTPRGFAIAAYTDDRATINYYLPSSAMQASCTVDVVWMDGDWRVKLGADGSTATGCVQGVPSSFVPWGP